MNLNNKTFLLFFRKDCPKCPAGKAVAEELKAKGYKVVYHDIDTVDGLAESAFHQVKATPTLVLVDEHDVEIAFWMANIPKADRIVEFCKGMI